MGDYGEEESLENTMYDICMQERLCTFYQPFATMVTCVPP